jgi:hypothetical protein
MGLPSRCLTMNVYSDFIISAFGRHVTISCLHTHYTASYRRPQYEWFILICVNAYFLFPPVFQGARGSAVGWDTMLQAARSPVRAPVEVDFSNLPNTSSLTMALGSTQPLTEISTRDLSRRKKCWRVGLTTLPPSVSRVSENVGAPTSRKPKGLHGLYRDKFNLPYLSLRKTDAI